jgi:hypothetical protein
MPDVLIPNPAGSLGALVATSGTQRVVDMVNNSGATRTYGDVVVVDATGTLATTTTTANDKKVIGVVGQTGQGSVGATQGDGSTFAANAVMPVIVEGIARINIGANTVAVNDLLTTTTTAAVAGTNAGAPAANAVIGSICAVALEANGAKDTNNTIRAYVMKA